MGGALTVLDPGASTAVQDLGRPGHGGIGVSASGAADRLSLRIGNRLVGNADGEAGLEIALTGARLRLDRGGRIALTGAPAEAAVGAGGSWRALAMWRPIDVEAGAEIRVRSVGRAGRGCRTYLAVRGGIRVAPVLGSRSAHARTGVGPAPCRSGDVLPLGETGRVGRACAADRGALVELERWVFRRTLRATPHPHADLLGEASLARLAAVEWTVSPDSDRVGLRLVPPRHAPPHPPAPAAGAGSLPTEAMAPGFIQAPPGGTPVLLGPDCAPTGGYPVLAGVISADLDAAGQLRPGDRVRFEFVSVDEARAIWRERAALLDRALPPVEGAARA